MPWQQPDQRHPPRAGRRPPPGAGPPACRSARHLSNCSSAGSRMPTGAGRVPRARRSATAPSPEAGHGERRLFTRSAAVCHLNIGTARAVGHMSGALTCAGIGGVIRPWGGAFPARAPGALAVAPEQATGARPVVRTDDNLSHESTQHHKACPAGLGLHQMGRPVSARKKLVGDHFC